jgi:hypothetical protein
VLPSPDPAAALATLQTVASPPTAPFHEQGVLRAIAGELDRRGIAAHRDRHGEHAHQRERVPVPERRTQPGEDLGVVEVEDTGDVDPGHDLAAERVQRNAERAFGLRCAIAARHSNKK